MIRIIRDSQEKKGFDFEFYDEVKVIREKLKTGDYTLDGHRDVIIERKKSPSEIYMNLSNTYEKGRFLRECGRLTEFRLPIILFEFPESYLYEFPKNSGIPEDKQGTLRMSAKYLRKMIYEIPENYPPIKLVFCDDRVMAEDYIFTLFKELQYGKSKKLDF